MDSGIRTSISGGMSQSGICRSRLLKVSPSSHAHSVEWRGKWVRDNIPSLSDSQGIPSNSMALTIEIWGSPIASFVTATAFSPSPTHKSSQGFQVQTWQTLFQFYPHSSYFSCLYPHWSYFLPFYSIALESFLYWQLNIIIMLQSVHQVI